jgi:hypothetical protein
MTSVGRRLGMLHAEARHLRDLIFAVAKARGVALREVSFRLEHEIPGGPMSAQKVLTVSGPSRQWSRSWHRKLDGSFDIWSAVDFLVALVQHEQAKPRPPELPVPKGFPAACSGLHVVHLAAVRLGVLPASSKPEGLVDRIENNWIRARIKTRLQDGGLHDADLRILADVAGLSVGRPNKWDGDPFEPFSDQVLPLAVVGKATAAGLERRYLLVVEHAKTKILIADPAGHGLAIITHGELLKSCNLGSKRGIPWIGLIGKPAG